MNEYPHEYSMAVCLNKPSAHSLPPLAAHLPRRCHLWPLFLFELLSQITIRIIDSSPPLSVLAHSSCPVVTSSRPLVFPSCPLTLMFSSSPVLFSPVAAEGILGCGAKKIKAPTRGAPPKIKTRNTRNIIICATGCILGAEKVGSSQLERSVRGAKR